MRITTGKIADGAINHIKLTDAMRYGQSVYERFDSQPVLALPGGFGDPTGTTGQINEATFRSGLFAQYAALGAGQTITGPTLDYATGRLDISEDQTLVEGVEYDWGGNSPRNPYAYTVGTDAARSWRWKFRIEDASGVGKLVIGIRKQAALAADFNDYTDMIALDIVGDSTPAAVVNIATILNNAATTVTDTALDDVTDGEELEYQLIMRGSRAYHYIRGAGFEAPVFDADTGDVFVPFTYYLHGTDLSKLFPLEFETAPERDLLSNP